MSRIGYQTYVGCADTEVHSAYIVSNEALQPLTHPSPTPSLRNHSRAFSRVTGNDCTKVSHTRFYRRHENKRNVHNTRTCAEF